jgi:predicted DCC family thiol-disulfide oxidoreductase YuxK
MTQDQCTAQFNDAIQFLIEQQSFMLAMALVMGWLLADPVNAFLYRMLRIVRYMIRKRRAASL